MGLGFAKSPEEGEYFIILEEGLVAQGIVVHRTLIPIPGENAMKFSDYIRKVVTGGLVIAKEGDIPHGEREGRKEDHG